MDIRPRIIRLAVILGLTAHLHGCLQLAPPGAFHRRTSSLHSLWFDCNTWGAPALTIEELEHRPLRARRVERFRWMYNAGPGVPPPVHGPISRRPVVHQPGPVLLPEPAPVPEPADSPLPDADAYGSPDRLPAETPQSAPDDSPLLPPAPAERYEAAAPGAEQAAGDRKQSAANTSAAVKSAAVHADFITEKAEPESPKLPPLVRLRDWLTGN